MKNVFLQVSALWGEIIRHWKRSLKGFRFSPRGASDTVCSHRMLQINPESTWITDKIWSSCVHVLQYSVTGMDLGQVSMSFNLIGETTWTGRTCVSFHFKYFVLLQLFEQRFYKINALLINVKIILLYFYIFVLYYIFILYYILLY